MLHISPTNSQCAALSPPASAADRIIASENPSQPPHVYAINTSYNEIPRFDDLHLGHVKIAPLFNTSHPKSPALPAPDAPNLSNTKAHAGEHHSKPAPTRRSTRRRKPSGKAAAGATLAGPTTPKDAEDPDPTLHVSSATASPISPELPHDDRLESSSSPLTEQQATSPTKTEDSAAKSEAGVEVEVEKEGLAQLSSTGMSEADADKDVEQVLEESTEHEVEEVEEKEAAGDQPIEAPNDDNTMEDVQAEGAIDESLSAPLQEEEEDEAPAPASRSSTPLSELSTAPSPAAGAPVAQPDVQMDLQEEPQPDVSMDDVPIAHAQEEEEEEEEEGDNQPLVAEQEGMSLIIVSPL